MTEFGGVGEGGVAIRVRGRASPTATSGVNAASPDHRAHPGGNPAGRAAPASPFMSEMLRPSAFQLSTYPAATAPPAVLAPDAAAAEPAPSAATGRHGRAGRRRPAPAGRLHRPHDRPAQPVGDPILWCVDQSLPIQI